MSDQEKDLYADITDPETGKVTIDADWVDEENPPAEAKPE